MTHPFDRDVARLALEICRFTYAAGVGNAANTSDQDNALDYIKSHSSPLMDPLPIVGGETLFACVVPYADRNVVSYMGTKTEFRAVKFSEFVDLLKNGDALSVALKAKGFVRQFLQSLKDWGNNGRARPVSFHLDGEHIGQKQGVTLEGHVHEGFLSELHAVQGEIVSLLRQLKHADGTDRKVLVTGHSQGGAEAALAARALVAAGFDVEVTYTFAAPRTGTQEFADSVTTPVHRIEFGDDIVPHLPPTLIRKLLEDFVAEHKLLLKMLTLLDDIEIAISSLTDFGYVGLGPLCYGDPVEKKFHIDLSAAEERVLLEKRLIQLKKNPKHWGDHHHLAGTNAEVSAGLRGNYTVLVSPEPEGWPIA